MALSESLDQQALRELGEETCPSCGDRKKRGRSFCGPCFFSLPDAMREALNRDFRHGYSTAYDEAKTWLKVER
jgi:hypothetical protein